MTTKGHFFLNWLECSHPVCLSLPFLVMTTIETICPLITVLYANVLKTCTVSVLWEESLITTSADHSFSHYFLSTSINRLNWLCSLIKTHILLSNFVLFRGYGIGFANYLCRSLVFVFFRYRKFPFALTTCVDSSCVFVSRNSFSAKYWRIFFARLARARVFGISFR